MTPVIAISRPAEIGRRTSRRTPCRGMLPAVLALLLVLGSSSTPSTTGWGWSLLSAASAAEELDPEQSARAMLTPATLEATHKALEYLAAKQNPDGTFGSAQYGQNVGVVGLIGLAFLSSGSTPGRGPFGESINQCVAYLMDHAQETGFICEPVGSSHGPMYGHGFATLFLAEVYGMSARSDLREKLTRAIKLIIETQNDAGGWRYQPQKRDADLSVTVCQIMALRAARNAGIHVPNEVIDRCLNYVKKSQNADGGFMYTLDGGSSEFPRSAAGVVALYSAGIYEGDELEKGLAYLNRFRPGAEQRGDDGSYFFYGHYYAVQAMWQKGGASWQNWFPSVRDRILQRQSADGSWVDAICPEYGTAMAAIILQIPNNTLPIFQR